MKWNLTTKLFPKPWKVMNWWINILTNFVCIDYVCTVNIYVLSSQAECYLFMYYGAVYIRDTMEEISDSLKYTHMIWCNTKVYAHNEFVRLMFIPLSNLYNHKPYLHWTKEILFYHSHLQLYNLHFLHTEFFIPRHSLWVMLFINYPLTWNSNSIAHH